MSSRAMSHHDQRPHGPGTCKAVMEENLKAVFPKMDFSFGNNNPADIQTTPIFRDPLLERSRSAGTGARAPRPQIKNPQGSGF